MRRDYCRSKAYHWESPVVRTHQGQMDRREERSLESITNLTIFRLYGDVLDGIEFRFHFQKPRQLFISGMGTS